MGHVHTRAWCESRRGALTAVADPSPQRARDLAKICGAGRTRIYPGLDALLENDGFDAVDICLPNDLHCEAVVAAARAGKHVFCEKPLCRSPEEAREIRTAVAETGIKLACAHNKLFAPPFLRAERMINDGALGDVVHVQVNELKRNLKIRRRRPPVQLADPGSTFAWRLDPVRMGGAELIDTGWHAAYRLLALVPSRPVEVVAFTANHLFQEVAGEDTAQMLVRFGSGAQGILLTTWAFAGSHGSWEFEVAGQAGTLAGDPTRLAYAENGSLCKVRTWRTNGDGTFRREIEHFLDVVLDDAPCKSGWEEAARTLQLILAGYHSAAESRVVSLPDDPTLLG
jgi:predicted dehydrogenase